MWNASLPVEWLGFFAHEHPHYFSRSSLSMVLERAGFKIELIRADISDPSIIAVARKRDFRHLIWIDCVAISRSQVR